MQSLKSAKLFICLTMLTGVIAAADPANTEHGQEQEENRFREHFREQRRKHGPPESVSFSFRMMIADSTTYFRCVVRNKSDRKIRVPVMFEHSNAFFYRFTFQDLPGEEMGVGGTLHQGPRDEVEVRAGEKHAWYVNADDLIERLASGGGNKVRGAMVKAKWMCTYAFSPAMWIAVPENGQLNLPEPPSEGVKPLLTVFYRKDGPADIGFLMFNGSEKAFDAPAPLSEKSVISVSIPGTDYTRDLKPSKSGTKTTTVGPGETAKWRVSWQRLIDLIPQKDIDRIKEEGGDFDLVWKVGDRASSPLPLHLHIPAKFDVQKRKKIDFLKEHYSRRRLDLEKTDITDKSLEPVEVLNYMETIDLTHTAITDEGLKHLQDLDNLSSLILDHTNITDNGLKHLQQSGNLRSLHLNHTDITDEGVKHLRQLDNLKYLYLGNTDITDKGLKHLRQLDKLKHLKLTNTAITNGGLKHLQQLDNLRSLQLSHTAITSEGLKHLKGLDNLQFIGLFKTNVTDEGLNKALKQVDGFKNLEVLNFKNTKVTDEGVEELKQNLPQLRSVTH